MTNILPFRNPRHPRPLNWDATIAMLEHRLGASVIAAEEADTDPTHDCLTAPAPSPTALLAASDHILQIELTEVTTRPGDRDIVIAGGYYKK